MNISARFGELIYDLGLYADRFDISGEILKNIPKTLYFSQNVEKNLLRVIFVKINRFDHVSDDIPVASFAVGFCTCMAELFLRQESKSLRLPSIAFSS